MSLMPSPSIWQSTNTDTALTTRVSTLEGKYVRTTRFVSIAGPGTSGTITLPANSSVVLDDFGGTVDAVVTTMSGGRPTYSSAVDGSGNVIATTFDSSGVYSFSGTPSAFPVGLVYRVRQTLANFDSTSSDIVGPPQVASSNVITQTITNGDTTHAPSGDAVFDALAVLTNASLQDIGVIDDGPSDANGLSRSGSTLYAQSASATIPGMVNNGTQSFSGNKTFTGTISASNLSGTNTGNVTLAAVGAVPNANSASLSGQALTLQPANTSFPGVLTASDWNTFNNKEATANKDATGGYVGLTLFKINFKNAANTFTSFFTNSNSAARTYTFQNRDGTIADDTDLALKAPLASPALTGSPTAPTQSASDNSTKIATTAYADAKVADAINDAVTTIAPSQNAVFDALALKAPLASPTLTGTPAAPTAGAGTNTTQLATTAFVTTAVASGVGAKLGFGTKINGNGSVPTTGSAGYIVVPFACTITNWYVIGTVADVLTSGSCVVDVKRSGTSIVGGGGNKPTLSSASAANAAVSGWTSTAVAENDTIQFNLDSVTTLKEIVVVIKVTRA